MNSSLSFAVSQSRQQDLIRAAQAARVATELPRRRPFARFGIAVAALRARSAQPVATVERVTQA